MIKNNTQTSSKWLKTSITMAKHDLLSVLGAWRELEELRRLYVHLQLAAAARKSVRGSHQSRHGCFLQTKSQLVTISINLHACLKTTIIRSGQVVLLAFVVLQQMTLQIWGETVSRGCSRKPLLDRRSEVDYNWHVRRIELSNRHYVIGEHGRGMRLTCFVR